MRSTCSPKSPLLLEEWKVATQDAGRNVRKANDGLPSTQTSEWSRQKMIVRLTLGLVAMAAICGITLLRRERSSRITENRVAVEVASDLSIYYFKLNGAVSFTEGQELCKRQGGDLAMIKSAGMQAEALKASGGATVWIGAARNPSSNSFGWRDGSHLTYTHWANGEPNGGVREACIEMVSNGRWNDIPCDHDKQVLCQRFRKRYFRLGKTWSAAEAQEMCASERARLAVIHTQKEEDDAKAACVSGQMCWIGLTRDEVSGRFGWDDGSDVVYRNWGAREPNGGASEPCGMMVTDGTWNDWKCRAPKADVQLYALCYSTDEW